MFVISGASGKTGGVVARALLGQKKPVRVLVRREESAATWRERGAEAAVLSLEDEDRLAAALAGASGFFAILPEDPGARDFDTERKRLAESIAHAVERSRVAHVVLLSSLPGGVAEGSGPGKHLYDFEQRLRATASRITVLRAASFQENVLLSLAPATHQGIYPNFLPAAELPFPTVATCDVGRVAASLLLEPPPANEVVDLVGPTYSAKDFAEALGRALGKTLTVVDLPAEVHADVLTKAGLSPTFASSVAEMYAAIAAGRVKPQGDRTLSAATTLAEILPELLSARA
jgi:uncharacterized protein YbjT (DUF2867 family)